jgi:ATP-dependent DNA ligase
LWRIKRGSEVQLITRGGEDVTENFPHLVELDWTPSSDINQLDCELYDPEQEDEVVSGWANRKEIEPSHVENCILKVFGILNYNGTNLANVTELGRKQILSTLRLRGACEEVKWQPANNHRQYYEYIISTPNKFGKFGEGLMLKHKNAVYVEGARRVGLWLKRKKRDPFDCVVLGFTQAKDGKFSGLIGAVTVGQYVGGFLRAICNVSGMDDNTRKDMTLSPESYLGKACSIWAMEQDRNSLALIEPSWKGLRIDKLPEDCIYEVVEKEEERMIEL